MSQRMPPEGDWAAQTADTIERLVGQVRQKTTKPVVTIARAVVFGLLAGILGVAAIVLVAITIVRVLDIVIPGGVWSAHLVAGLIFCIAGTVLMLMRHAPPEAT
jgi:predicted phage tail protein